MPIRITNQDNRKLLGVTGGGFTTIPIAGTDYRLVYLGDETGVVTIRDSLRMLNRYELPFPGSCNLELPSLHLALERF